MLWPEQTEDKSDSQQKVGRKVSTGGAQQVVSSGRQKNPVAKAGPGSPRG